MIQRIQSLYLLIAGLIPAIFPFVGPARIEMTTVCAVLALLSFAALFLYKTRRTQMTLCRIGLVAALALYLLHFYPEAEGGNHWKLLVPAAYQLLTWLALRAIRHDENLVRAADRIR